MEAGSLDTVELNMFSSDFSILCHIRDSVLVMLKQCSVDLDRCGEEFINRTEATPDGRKLRYVLPHGLAGLRDFLTKPETSEPARAVSRKEPTLCFVGFFGIKKSVVSADIEESLKDNDDDLINELRGIGQILWYTTFETVPGGDYANFVLLRDLSAVDSWREVAIHDKAVREIAPRLYQYVRIHTGYLEEGLHSTTFRVDRTTFLDYTKYSTTGQIYRQVASWASGAHGADLVTAA